MPATPPDPPRRIEPFDRGILEARLRQIASEMPAARWLDDHELRHLIRVVAECSLLMTDVYSPSRLERIMNPDRGSLAALVHGMIEEERRGEGEVFYRVRRLPDDVRLVGDKALFDLGLLGVHTVKGYDLTELGSRAYRLAGEVLELLAEDRRLREFFRDNRLLMLPLEQEVEFLKQAADRFGVYFDLLRRAHAPAVPDTPLEALRDDLARSVPLLAAAADALTLAEAGGVSTGPVAAGVEAVDYAEAALGRADSGSQLNREELLSAYERMLLFAALDLDVLRRGLTSVVVDQDQAVDALIDEFGLFAAGTRDLRKPPAYFLVGPTGVGKNHVVESLVRLLEGVWGVDIPMLTIEGPNYTYPSDINELKGAARGFIRSDEEGLLAAFHERSSRTPFSVILVDEIEKAHPQLRTFFLSILDRGTTTDNRGRLLNFSNSMVFFTSNLGYSDAMQRASPIGYGDADAREGHAGREIAQDLRRALKPEFLNRLRMIHFHPLGRDSAERILDLEIARIARRYADVHGVTVELAPSAREELLRRGFSPRYGARHMAATLERACNVEIARRILRDDRRDDRDRAGVLAWLRSIREGGTAHDLDEVRRRVLDSARARLDYDVLRVEFVDGRFEYVPVSSGRTSPS